MKQILEKFQNVFLEGLEKLENENIKEAVEKFKEVSELFPNILEKSEEMDLEKTLKKFFESEFWEKTLKKYTQNLENWLKNLQKDFSELKKEKENDDKVISENLEKIFDTIENISSRWVSKIND